VARLRTLAGSRELYFDVLIEQGAPVACPPIDVSKL